MNTQKIKYPSNDVSLRTAALLAGLVVFIPTAPFAEFYVMQSLVIPREITETVQNLRSNQSLFIAGLFGYLITFILDLLLAWALYIFLSPVNKMFSLFTAIFRIVYAAIAVVALLNLFTVLDLLRTVEYESLLTTDQLHAQVQLSLNAFRNGMTVGFIIFGIYLTLLGSLVYRSNYIPSILGVLVIIAGLGYLTSSLQPFLFPAFRPDYIIITFFGELIFTLWLLVKGSRIKPFDKPIIFAQT